MKYIIFLISFLAVSNISFAQKDSIEMSKDFGISAIRNVKLYPIIEIIRAKDKKDVKALFSLYGYSKDEKLSKMHAHILPIYWYDSTKNSKDLRLLSLYYPSLLHFSRNDLLEERSFRFFEIVPHISLLEFSKAKDGWKVDNNAFFFLWQKVDSTQHKSSLVVFPIYWQFKNPQKSTLTLFPLYRGSTYNRGLSKYFAFTPLFWHFEKLLSIDDVMYPKGNKRVSNTLFPIYWAHHDAETNKHVLFPFVWQYKTLTYQSFSFAPLLSFGHARDNSSSHLMLTPLFWHYQNAFGYKNTFFPLWWNSKKQVGDNTIYTNYIFPTVWSYSDKNTNYKLIFPLWFSYKKPEYQSKTLLPLFSVGGTTDGTSSHLMLASLFWRLKDKDAVSTTFIPLFRTKRKFLLNDTITNTYIFPTIWSHRDKNRSSAGVFPIFWTHKDSISQGTSLLPLFSYGTNASHNQSHLMLTPLFWHRNYHGSYHNVFFPLVWNYKTFTIYDTTRTNVLFPLVWDFKNSNTHTFVLPPLVAYRGQRDGAASILGITPLFWHSRLLDKTHDVLFPILWHKSQGKGLNKESSTTILPFLFWYKKAEISRLTIFPLLGSYKDSMYRSFTLLPLVSRGKSLKNNNNYLALTPLFWHVKQADETRNVLLPLFWNIKKGTGETASRLNLLLPFFGAYQDKNENNWVLFPFMWKYSNPVYHSFTFIPFVSLGHTPDLSRKHLTITPLFWRTENKGDVTNLLLPVWWNTKQGQGRDRWDAQTLFPIYWAYRDSSTNNKIVLPLIWSLKNENYRSFTFIPFFSKGQRTDSSFKHLAITPFYWQFNYEKSFRKILFPLYWFHKDYNLGYPRTWNTLFPVYFSYSDSARNNKVLFPIIWSLKDPHYRLFSFMPFYSIGRAADSTRSFFSISPLFWHTQNSNTTRNILFPIFWNKTQGSFAFNTHKTVLFPLYWHYRDENENNNVLFPLIWSYRSPSYKSFALFPLVAWGKSPISQRGYFALTPLYWHKTSLAGTKDVLFPIFFHSSLRQGDQRKVKTTIFPLYYAYRDSITNNKTVFPLVWWRKNAERKSLGVFPLFSYYHRADSTKTRLMVTPLYWHIEKPSYTQNIIFPIWWGKSYKETAAAKRSMVFPIYFAVRDSNRNNKVLLPLYWSFRNKQYASLTLPPIFSAGSSPDHSVQHLMLTPIFWHFKNKDNYRNILFPLWWNSESGEGKNATATSVFFPLYFSHRDSVKHNQAIIPLIYSLKNPFYKSFTILPIYSSGHTPDHTTHHLVATPLFWDVKYAEAHVNMLFPLYSYYKDTAKLTKFNILQFVYRFKQKVNRKEISFLWPLLEYQTDVDYSYFRLSPLVWYNHDNQVQYLYIPFLYHHRVDQEADSKQVLLWAYYAKHEFGVKRTKSLFWHLSWSDKYENGDYEKHFARNLYVNKNVKGNTEQALFPFYHHTVETNGNFSHSGFLAFNSTYKKQITGTKEFYQEQKTLWLIRVKSNFKSLKERGIVKDRKDLR